ncbi:MAG: 3-methyl-2-oxobutanoate dehydrogenase subunit VorB [Elusimicrobiota bacterium]
MSKKLLKGNYALVEGAIHGGADAYFGYPITPQNEVIEHMSERMRSEGRVFLQSESELAAINMVFGAALTGKKAITTSSSPGVSLMQEGISYLAGCELPAVIANIQRGGPGLGNISGAQGDYFQTVKGGGHGDYRLLTLAPCNVEEMYKMTRESFDLAFKYRCPVFILSDGVIGQTIEPADIDDNPPVYESRSSDLGWNLNGCRGRERRIIRSLYMKEGELEELNYRLAEKYEKMEKEVRWEERDTEDADVILVGYGTSARINYDACIKARKMGLKVGFFRPKTLYPFPSRRIRELSKKSDFLVVEMSMGQMVEDVRLSVSENTKVDFYGRPAGGLPETEQIIKRCGDILK